VSGSKTYDARRRAGDAARKLYNDPRWKEMRKAALYPKDRPRPICAFCKKRYATILDHKEPHLGDPERFWAGPFLLLCKICHDSIKQSIEKANRPEVGEDGFAIEGTMPKGWVPWDELHRPTDLKPSKPALTMIFGPPASGKSTYVYRHARKGHFIVDADIEAVALGYDRYTLNTSERVRILKARNARYRELSTSDAEKAWSTALGAKANVRGHFIKKLKPVQVIILKPTPQVCIERIRNSDRTHKEEQIAAVRRWFKDYQPRGGEKLLTDY